MPGKKAKDPSDWKVKSVIIRLSEADYQALKRISAKRGLSVSEIVRSLIHQDKEGKEVTVSIETAD